MLEFKKYQRKGLSEMIAFKDFIGQDMSLVSVSDVDKLLPNEAFEQGYIARNPRNHNDLWYVSKQYFDENLEEVTESKSDKDFHGLLYVGKGTFGQAIEALKQGKLVARKGWNGKGMFIFMRPADSLNYDFIINKVKSLPEGLKNRFNSIIESGVNSETKEHLLKTEVEFTAYLCMYAADGSIVNGWLASQTDMLAEDWVIVE